MNYLAHLYLSCENEDLLIGNFIADSIRNKDLESYPESVQAGIQLHRQIDSYTDQHPIVRQATQRLHPQHHKYAPVVIDILYDHLLAKNWSSYSITSLDDFTKSIYEVLERRSEQMPAELRGRLPDMIKHNWLSGYATREGMLITLRKMDERSRFESNFAQALDHLEADWDTFNEEFNRFFPELIQYVTEECKC
ncbi:MAG: acyl carrier protein phosphodiesterase [Bacteroidota bacterium]